MKSVCIWGLLLTLLQLAVPLKIAAQPNTVDNKGQKQGLWRTKEAKGRIREEYYTNDTLNGSARTYSKNGNPTFTINYLNGIPHGDFTAYYSNGVIRIKGTFDHGKFDGEYIEYSSNGKPQKIIDFAHGIWNGRWIFLSNDQEIIKAQFVNGKINGWYYDYFNNGQINHQIFFDHGIIVSSQRTFNRKGRLLHECISNKKNNMLKICINYNRDGSRKSRMQNIDEKPLTYILFGKQVHVESDGE